MYLLCITFDTKIQLAPIIGATIAAMVVVIGWFIISYLNRKNEIAKEARRYRIDMLNSIINFVDIFIKNKVILTTNIETGFNDEVNEAFEKVSTEILLYGKKDEIVIFMGFCDAYNNYRFIEEQSLQNLINALNKLAKSCRDNIRKELNLKKYNEK